MPDDIIINVDDPPSVEDEADEVDEILKELQSQKTVSETRLSELSERIGQCLSRLDQLSAGAQAENPLLTQLSNQIAEMRVDVTAALKSLEDMKAKNLEPSESPVVVETVVTDPALPSLENQTDELPEESEAPITPVRKNRML